MFTFLSDSNRFEAATGLERELNTSVGGNLRQHGPSRGQGVVVGDGGESSSRSSVGKSTEVVVLRNSVAC